MLFKRCYCFQEPLADMNTLCLPSMVTYLFSHDAIRVTYVCLVNTICRQ
jgi:hypothetical protein